MWIRYADFNNFINSGSNMQLLMSSPLIVNNVLSSLSNITLATGTTFTISSINASENGGSYSCIVINGAGIGVNTTSLYVRPDITQQPVDVLTETNKSVSIICIADSFPSPQYIWQKLNIMSGLFETITGETSRTLLFTHITYQDFGSYRCVAMVDGIVENATSNVAVITG